MVDPVLLIVVPLGLAFAVPLLRRSLGRLAAWVPAAGMLFNLVVSLMLLPGVIEKPRVIAIGGFPPPFCINLVAGPLAVGLSALIALVGLAVSIYAWGYIRQGAQEKYHSLYLLLLAGATGAVLTGDLFNLFVFYEILCISSYALVAYLGDRNGVEAAVKYLIQGSVGSGLILIGIAVLYGLFGTLNMAQIAANVEAVSSPPLFVALVLLVTGFGVEAAVFPLNAWLPDAHSSAPSSISAILSGIAIKVGVYAVARILFTVFGASSMFHFLLLLGLLTLLVGEMSAFRQSNIKRMLAYSSVGQVGLIIFALGLATPAGLAGALFQLVSHALAKSVLFLAAGYMIYRAGSMDLAALEGMGRRMPLTSFAFAVGALSLVGLPPFTGFPSKFLIVRAALATQDTLTAVFVGLVLVCTVIEAAYFFRVIQTLFFKGTADNPAPAPGTSEGGPARARAPATALVPLFVLTVLIVVLGMFPGLVTGTLDSAATELLNRIAYIKGVLG